MGVTMKSGRLGAALVLLSASSMPLRAQFPVEDARLLPLDPAAGLYFGTSVGIDGDTVVVGVPNDSRVHPYAGSAYVFVRAGTAWVQQQKLVPVGSAEEDLFGQAVAISGDTIVVGGPQYSAFPEPGAAWVFDRIGTVWTETQKLVSSDGGAFDLFGEAVAIDGDRIAVTASMQLGVDAGALYVFSRSGGAWTEDAILVPSVATGDDWFGESVAIHGNTVVAGGPQPFQTPGLNGYVAVFTEDLGTWSEQAIVTLPGGDELDRFGWSVALGDGELLAGDSSDGQQGNHSGAVHTFTRTGSSWSYQSTLRAGDGEPGDLFGSRLALDGDTAVVGAHRVDDLGDDAGAAYVFVRTGSTWVQRAKLLPSDGAAGDSFGSGVGVSGTTVVCSAPRHDRSFDEDGAAYVFEVPPVVGTPFCFGDGSGTACPCGNESSVGLGAGCANSTGEGGRLEAFGTESVGLDAMGLAASNLLAGGKPCLLGAGTAAPNAGAGFPFGGDGLRCIGGHVRRLAIRFTENRLGLASWGPGLAAAHGFNPGETWHFQVWYRDPGTPCGGTFNTTNAVEVVFAP